MDGISDDDERPAPHIGCSGSLAITPHPFFLVRENNPNTDRTAAVSTGNVLKPSGQLRHTLCSITQTPHHQRPLRNLTLALFLTDLDFGPHMGMHEYGM